MAKQSSRYPMNFNSRLASVIRSYQGREVRSEGVRISVSNNLDGASPDEPVNLTRSSTELPPSGIESDNDQRRGQCLLVDFPNGSKRRNVHSDSEDESSLSTISGASGGNQVRNYANALIVNAFGVRTVGRTMQREIGNHPVSKQSYLPEARTSHQEMPATVAQHFPTVVVVVKKAQNRRR